jgi:hypothetical protein
MSRHWRSAIGRSDASQGGDRQYFGGWAISSLIAVVLSAVVLSLLLSHLRI